MSAPTRILAFDTSGPHCAAALLVGDRIVAMRHEEMGRGQAERLLPMLEDVLEDGGCAWRDLDAIGVGIGPGNFTGIRIAVSAARGLALALGKPAVGVSAFEALAFGTAGVVIASVAAPRGNVYAQVMHHDGARPVLGEAESIALSAPARAGPSVIGAETKTLASRFAGHSAAPACPMIEAIARVALARKNNAGLPRPMPLYVRSADAAPASDPPPVILP